MTVESRTLAAFAGALALCASSPLPLGAEEESSSRVRNGLLVLYDFSLSDGDVVRDRSGVGVPLDLEIADLEAVVRREGALEVRAPTLIKSLGGAPKINDAVRLSEEVTVEAWITPADDSKAETATIIAVSPRDRQLNFWLGRGEGGLAVRFRTTRTGVEARTPSIAPVVLEAGKPTHLVYARDRVGAARLYLDGKPVLAERVRGSTAGWERFPAVLANELDGGSPWLGTYHLAAIYGRALTAGEVERNFRAGPEFRAEPTLSEATAGEAGLFEAKAAPLLSRHCLKCHDAATKSGGLDLSTREGAFAEGPNGAAVVPGDSAASRLTALIENDSMPPGGPPLLKSEKAALREWIDGGAPWTLGVIAPAGGAAPERAGAPWVRRLTVPEYVATVKASLGVDAAREAAEILPPDERADGFRNTDYNLTVDLGHVEAYARLAAIVVEKMDVESFARKHAPSRDLSRENREALIVGLSETILRAPPNEDEIASYQGLAQAVVQGGGDFEETAAYLVEAMLQSPRFLYRIENQRGDGTAWPAGEYELASRLSYILWGAPPDDELRAEADTGRLRDPAAFDRQVRRMLRDPRTIERSLRFVSEWLDLDRLDHLRPDPAKFPQWDSALAADMREETLRFFREVVWDQGRPITDLLNARFTYATPRLAQHYGLEPKASGFARYDLSATPSRGGLLTQGSVLTIGGDGASMVARGLFILHELLSGEVGSPPPGLDTTPPPLGPGRSNRAISEGRVKSAACGGCHSKFEPLAFGLERFDGVGAYRETDEHGNALREDGQALFPGESRPIPYNRASELMDLLAESDRVRRSLTRKVAQFALGRRLVAEDEPALAEIQRQAERDGFTYAGLLTALLKSDLVQMTRTEPRFGPSS